MLVHCYAGVNRSASAIVAYMMMRRGIPFVDAATSVAEIVLARRRVPALTNARFKVIFLKEK